MVQLSVQDFAELVRLNLSGGMLINDPLPPDYRLTLAASFMVAWYLHPDRQPAKPNLSN